MLWTLLTLTSSLCLFVGAVGAATHAHAGAGGYALTIAAGIVLAVCNAWVFEQVARAGLLFFEHRSRSFERWCGGAVFVAAYLWGLVAVVIGQHVGSLLVRLVA
jgi:hypothetical protein